MKFLQRLRILIPIFAIGVTYSVFEPILNGVLSTYSPGHAFVTGEIEKIAGENQFAPDAAREVLKTTSSIKPIVLDDFSLKRTEEIRGDEDDIVIVAECNGQHFAVLEDVFEHHQVAELASADATTCLVTFSPITKSTIGFIVADGLLPITELGAHNLGVQLLYSVPAETSWEQIQGVKVFGGGPETLEQFPAQRMSFPQFIAEYAGDEVMFAEAPKVFSIAYGEKLYDNYNNSAFSLSGKVAEKRMVGVVFTSSGIHQIEFNNADQGEMQIDQQVFDVTANKDSNGDVIGIQAIERGTQKPALAFVAEYPYLASYDIVSIINL